MTQSELLQLASTCGNILAYRFGMDGPDGYTFRRDLSISSSNGYQAATYYNESQNQYLYCIAGTNGMSDVVGWNAILTGYSGNSAQYDSALKNMSALSILAKSNKDSVLAAGHSFAGVVTDMGTYTFGFTSVKFDAVGGWGVINSSVYNAGVSALGITPVGGGVSISIKVDGWGPLGGGIVGLVGSDLPGTVSGNVEVKASLLSGLVEAGGWVFGGPSLGLAVRAAMGVDVHSSDGIDRAIQAGDYSLNSALATSESSNRAQARVRMEQAVAASAAAAAVVAAERASVQAQAITTSSGSGGGGSNVNGGSSGYGGSQVQAGSATSSAPNQGPGWTPIVIDLDGNGIQLQTLGNSTARFDADNDGYREATAWASAQDGILVIDEGNDNLVTQTKEVAFSNWTAATGDTDLQALAKIGIKSMNLTVKSGTSSSLSDGTQVFGLTDVQRTDGSIVQAADVAFAYNNAGYRTRTDSGGNTVYEFESGTTLNYRNIAATATGAAANFNLGKDTDAPRNAIRKIASCSVFTETRDQFRLNVAANAAHFWRIA
ncbi:MAG: hypothetical protein RLZZ573_88 [Pseudomonadota bacterium]